MHEELKNSLVAALTWLDECQKPHPPQMNMTLEEMTKAAIACGGPGSHVSIECRIPSTGKTEYGFTIWDSRSKVYATSDNAAECLALFQGKCRPPSNEPANTTEEVDLMLSTTTA